MNNRYTFLFTLFFLNFLLLQASRNEFFSYCSLFPEKNIWRKNLGYDLQSWLSSIVPSSSFNNNSKEHATFYSNEHSILVKEVISKHGPSWRAYGHKKYDGWLYGHLNAAGEFKAGKTYYLFSDFKTALVGTFNGVQLIEGLETKATHYRCRGGIMELQFEDPKRNAITYRYMESTDTLISNTPKIRDPFDRKSVYIGSSHILTEIADQDALFARKNFPPFSLISYYNGIRINTSNIFFLKNETLVERSYKFKYLISYNDTHNMDIPVEMADIKNYRATLGHKTNHHFTKNNAQFCFVKHPIYGEIRGLEAKTYIGVGKEILTHYGYDLNSESVPDWYSRMYHDVLNEKIYV